MVCIRLGNVQIKTPWVLNCENFKLSHSSHNNGLNRPFSHSLLKAIENLVLVLCTNLLEMERVELVKLSYQYYSSPENLGI